MRRANRGGQGAASAAVGALSRPVSTEKLRDVQRNKIRLIRGIKTNPQTTDNIPRGPGC